MRKDEGKLHMSTKEKRKGRERRGATKQSRKKNSKEERFEIKRQRKKGKC